MIKMIFAEMKRKLTFGLGAICLLASPAMGEEPFDCKLLSDGELRIYNHLGIPMKMASGGWVKVKRGAIVLDEQRALIAEQFKPEGEIGSLIPYKRPQILFSRYLIEGREKICSRQRHEDVFAVGELAEQYLLRCLNDADGDGIFETYRRYVELVSFNSRTRILEEPTGTLQTDHPLTQPFKVVATEDAKPAQNQFEPVLRSTIKIIAKTKHSVMLQTRSFATIDLGNQFISDRYPSVTVEIPLLDGTSALIGETKVSIRRMSSGWEISAPDGFRDETNLICGGTALDTGHAISVFSGGGLQILDLSSRHTMKIQPLE
jgi:hypothetical protein